jgi:hypothetical protein
VELTSFCTALEILTKPVIQSQISDLNAEQTCIYRTIRLPSNCFSSSVYISSLNLSHQKIKQITSEITIQQLYVFDEKEDVSTFVSIN